ncbi:hypothetical protein ACRALDRAFT_2042244 [Sodiomyces alcalophilus JCM 7366]|uniref:uncharacterized protein n=1 Tax=Sodiomyces alcalophilus JCM 7366 TaxID=591952 RepID=UPI0039B418A2
MDLAYDHINQEDFSRNNKRTEDKSKDPNSEQQSSLDKDLQEAYKAISTSAWGVKIGGFLGNAVKQGQSVYREASKEVSDLGQDAAKGLNSLQETIVSRTRGLSITTSAPQTTGEPASDKEKDVDEKGEATPTNTRSSGSGEVTGHSEETYLARLRAEAAKRLKDLQRAEDAADEALLRFGTNISNFLKEAVSIAPPSDSNNQGGDSKVLFESKDAQGKRVIHASRQDAQLHAIHTSADSFSRDPATQEFVEWSKNFDVEKKTSDISDDLAKYPELRSTMEKLVPDQLPYADFWSRYYFLRHGLDAAEARRRDLLQAASVEDDIGWGDDSDDDDDEDTQSKADQKKPAQSQKHRPASVASSSTIQPPAPADSLKPIESRKSNDEKSQASSEASYDVVGAASGVASQAPSSPKESGKADDSDEDWE